MDFDDTPDEAAFRAEARSWLEANAVPKGHPDDYAHAFFEVGADWEHLDKRCRDWHRRRFEGGWAGLSYPREYGGRGGTTMHELIFGQELDDFGEHNGMFSVAHNMVGPALLELGTDEQRRRFIPAMLRGDEIWCQLFSEPDAGSDLAGLGTRAVRDGDEFVVNGQKIWTTYANHSQWGILLARTDPDAPKHRGITYFLVDMATPGIETRPIVEMTGGTHFCEVFFTDVRVPATNILGGESALNQGWRAAVHTLANERNMIGSAPTAADLEGLLALARETGTIDDPRVRQDLARTYTTISLLRYFGYRAQTAFSRGAAPGPETSVSKLLYSNHLRDSTRLGKAILGARGMLDGTEGGEWPAYIGFRFVWAVHSSIAGGTSEVQRNILGERVLGLPGEPRLDGGPFRAGGRADG